MQLARFSKDDFTENGNPHFSQGSSCVKNLFFKEYNLSWECICLWVFKCINWKYRPPDISFLSSAWESTSTNFAWITFSVFFCYCISIKFSSNEIYNFEKLYACSSFRFKKSFSFRKRKMSVRKALLKSVADGIRSFVGILHSVCVFFIQFIMIIYWIWQELEERKLNKRREL